MNDGGFDAGFLDVAANALAIMIFVTMFALLTVRSEPTVLHDPRFERELPLTLRVQPPLAERPFLDYYLVFDAMIVRWEQERYVEHLIEHGLRDTVRAEGGKLRVSARREPRDPDSYTASFVPDLDALAARAAVLTAQTADAVAAEIRDREKDARPGAQLRGLSIRNECLRSALHGAAGDSDLDAMVPLVGRRSVEDRASGRELHALRARLLGAARWRPQTTEPPCGRSLPPGPPHWCCSSVSWRCTARRQSAWRRRLPWTRSPRRKTRPPSRPRSRPGSRCGRRSRRKVSTRSTPASTWPAPSTPGTPAGCATGGSIAGSIGRTASG